MTTQSDYPESPHELDADIDDLVRRYGATQLLHAVESACCGEVDERMSDALISLHTRALLVLTHREKRHARGGIPIFEITGAALTEAGERMFSELRGE